MSFLPAVQQQINNRQPNDPVRITLEYLMQNGLGRNNPVSLESIVTHLQSRGVHISDTGFQQTVLADSRDADYFIGSGRRGYFLIDDIRDAEEMRDFYIERVKAEEQNLNNLKRQAGRVGWTI